MCTSYGVDPDRLPDMRGLPPMDERDSAALHDWAAEHERGSKITGRIARNLNPVITADGKSSRMTLGWWSIWRDGTGPFGRFGFNSRDDSLMRYWRREFQHRALIPASWYEEGKKRWELPSGEGFLIAAVTSTVIEEATGEERLTYSMVTRRGIGEASTVVSSRGESRMPLVLPTDLHTDWLDPKLPGDAELVAHVQHASEEISRALTVV